jgi:tetratricopeptide (TPR) repeat protein
MTDDAATPKQRDVERPGIIGLAMSGGDLAESLLRRVLRSMGRSAPEMAADLRSEVRAAKKASRAGDADGSLHHIAGLAEGFLQSGSPELAAVLCGVGVNLATNMSADEPDVLAGRSNLHNVAGLLAMRIGRYPEASNCFQEARSLALKAEDRSLAAATLLNLSNTARVAGDMKGAERHARAALDLYQDQEDQRGQIQLLQTLGSIAVETGDLDGAEYWVSRASTVLRGHRDPGLTSGNHHLRGRIQVLQGDLDAAEASLRLAVDAARRAKDSDKTVAALQSWSAVANDADRPAVARRRLMSAVSLAEEGHLWWRLHGMLPALVRLQLRTGRKAEALSTAQRLLDVARDAQQGMAEAEALLGAAMLDNGMLEPGLEQLEAAWDSLIVSPGERSELRKHTVHNLIVGHSLNQTLQPNAQGLAERARTLTKDSRADALQQLGLYLAIEARATTPTGAGPEQVGALLLESLNLRAVRRRAWPSLLMASHLEELDLHAVAVPLLRFGLAAARRAGQETMIRQIRNDLGLALVQVGEYPAALRLFQQNIEAGSADEDLQTVRLAYFNRSETYRRIDRQEDAEADARVALRIAEDSDNSDDLGEARVQLALTLMDQGLLDEAQPLLELVVGSAAEPGTRAAALSSLGNVALGHGRRDQAADLYRHALRVGERHPKGKAETLLGLCEALAASGSLRPYVRALQRAIDALALVRYDVDLASRFLRCAMRWHDNGKASYAAEAVAVAILVGAAQVEGDDESVDEDSPLLVGLGVAMGALGSDGPFYDDPTFVSLLESRLSENVSNQTARALIRFLRDLLD